MSNIYFDEFVRQSAFSEEGYYLSSKSLKDKGDFITSPLLSKYFGSSLGYFIINEVITKFGNTPFNIIELGCNDALLTKHILDYIKTYNLEIYNLISFILIDQNYKLRSKIEANLEDHESKFIFLTDLKSFDAENKNSFLFCNELFDALPFHRCISRENKLFEISIFKDEMGKYIEKEVAARQELINRISSLNIKINNNYFFEFPGSEFFDILYDINNLKSNILLLIIDYGEKQISFGSPKNPNGTARCFQNNKVSQNFYDRNQKDITYSINFEILLKQLSLYGFSENYYKTQSRFLLDNFFLDIINDEINKRDIELVKLKNLVSPVYMGEVFKVIQFSRII
jgi:SAM-dependent MidA family methyltransferase|tara:strand:- start:95054 stop:96079 length:1026 start_codon:yes stop_codon:yes gene_type:complete